MLFRCSSHPQTPIFFRLYIGNIRTKLCIRQRTALALVSPKTLPKLNEKRPNKKSDKTQTKRWDYFLLRAQEAICLTPHEEDDNDEYNADNPALQITEDDNKDEDEERAEQPEEDASMGDDFSPPGYLQVRRERQEFQFSGKVEQILRWLPCTG